MSLRINYDGSNNIFFITSLIILSTKEGIAVDALSVIFQNLYEASIRLERKLFDISTEEIGSKDSKSETQIIYRSLLGDTWAIIDGIRRLQLLVKYIPNLPAKIKKELTDLFEKVKCARDSFQHIDERIDLHFDKKGGSVFGEIFSHYRERIDIPEVLHCLITGVSRISRDLVLDPKLELPQHAHKTGIYDLELVYIKQDSRKTKTHSKVLVNIDEAVNCVNNLIDYLEDRYSRLLENSDKVEVVDRSDPTLYQTKAMTCDPPRIFRFKVKLEAFQIIYRQRLNT